MVLVANGVVGEAPKCGAEGCNEKATQAYLWAWGEKGVCCALHAQLLQQTASQIERTIQFHPLLPAAPEPLQRDERARLKAEAYVLGEELEEAKARGLELYRINDQLRGQARLLEVREAEAHAQLRDAQAQLAELRQALGEREAENANLVMEIERMRALAAFSSPPHEPEPTGGEGNVVD